MEQLHVDNVVELHITSFPLFFLSFLGSKFLREMYRYFVDDSSCIALIAKDSISGSILGFAVGTLTPVNFFKGMLIKRWWAFAIASIPAIAKNPKIIARLIRAFLYRGNPPIGKERALLSSIAVAPTEKGTGLGSEILGRWVKETRNKGGKGCYLTTDEDNNSHAKSFYENNGWRQESRYITPEGRRMIRYALDWE